MNNTHADAAARDLNAAGSAEVGSSYSEYRLRLAHIQATLAVAEEISQLRLLLAERLMVRADLGALLVEVVNQ